MDIARRRRLLSDIQRSPQSLEQIYVFMKASGYDIEAGIDMMQIEPEILAIVHYIIHSDFPEVDEDDRKEKWRKHRSKMRPSFIQDVQWLTQKRGAPSKVLTKLLHECHENSLIVRNPGFVQQSSHNGKSVGLGLFSLLSIRRGQCVFQFTGSVHQPENFSNYLKKNAGRRDYCIKVFYGIKEYIINPLMNNDAEVNPNHFAAYMNEPSPPPWKQGDLAKHGVRNVLIHDYDGEYTIEYANGLKDFVQPGNLTNHPLHRQVDASFESNCLWYDFPVPLTDLYKPTMKRRGEEYVYKRTDKDECVIRWSTSDLMKAFSAFSDTKAVYRMGNVTLQPGHIVLLKENVFQGLHRYGEVVEAKGSHILVRHIVQPSVVWRLAQRVLVGKHKLCSSCKLQDNPRCQKCSVVPFPLVHACKDIDPGEEFLCLYSSQIKSRGLPCREMLDSESMRPRWDELYDNSELL
jgi:hypothetical protein